MGSLLAYMNYMDHPWVDSVFSSLSWQEKIAQSLWLAIGPDDVGAAAVDAIFVPGPGVHEGFDEEAEGVAFAELVLFENLAEFAVVATALGEVFNAVVDFVFQEALNFGEVDEVGNGADALWCLEQVADGSAVRVAAGERSEVVELESVRRLLDGAKDDVGGI